MPWERGRWVGLAAETAEAGHCPFAALDCIVTNTLRGLVDVFMVLTSQEQLFGAPRGPFFCANASGAVPASL